MHSATRRGVEKVSASFPIVGILQRIGLSVWLDVHTAPIRLNTAGLLDSEDMASSNTKFETKSPEPQRTSRRGGRHSHVTFGFADPRPRTSVFEVHAGWLAALLRTMHATRRIQLRGEALHHAPLRSQYAELKMLEVL